MLVVFKSWVVVTSSFSKNWEIHNQNNSYRRTTTPLDGKSKTIRTLASKSIIRTLASKQCSCNQHVFSLSLSTTLVVLNKNLNWISTQTVVANIDYWTTTTTPDNNVWEDNNNFICCKFLRFVGRQIQCLVDKFSAIVGCCATLIFLIILVRRHLLLVLNFNLLFVVGLIQTLGSLVVEENNNNWVGRRSCTGVVGT